MALEHIYTFSRQFTPMHTSCFLISLIKDTYPKHLCKGEKSNARYPNMPPKSSYPDGTGLNDRYTNYPPSVGLRARPRTTGGRQNVTVYEDPDGHEDNETAATPMAHSPTDPDPDQENQNPEMIPGPQADIRHSAVNNNVGERLSMYPANGLQQMMLATPRRRPIASATQNFIRRNNNARQFDPPTSLSSAYGSVLHDITGADEIYAERPRAERDSIICPIRNDRGRLIRHALRRHANNITNDRELIYPERINPLIGEGDVGRTPIGAVANLFVQTPPMIIIQPPRTPASQSKPTQSPASRLLSSPRYSPALIVRSTGTHDDGVDPPPVVVRQLFGKHATNLVSTPAPNRNASEPQLVLPQTLHDPHRPSRLRSVSFTSAVNGNAEMASPSVATPECQTGETRVPATECRTGETHVTTPQSQTRETPVITPKLQTGGTPPTPHAPHTPNTWISPSQVTPDLVARMLATAAYRNRDEPMEMTPCPPELKPASPDDRKIEDAFWTPNKPAVSLNVAGFQKNVAAAQNPAPMEYKDPIVNSAPFGDAMAQEPAPIQNVAPIGNPAPVQGAMSPGTTTVRTVVSTEITTTIMKTPSPPESPIPARRPTENLRRIAATPHKTANNTPRRQVASTPQRKGNGGAEQKTNRRRTTNHIIPGGINRRQELRNSPRYSLRDSTRGIMPGTYLLTPVRNRPFEAESASKEKKGDMDDMANTRGGKTD